MTEPTTTKADARRRLFKRALAERSVILTTVTLGALGTILIIWQMSLLSRVIDGAFLQASTWPALQGPLAWLLTVIFVRVALLWLHEFIVQRGATRIKLEFRHKLFEHLLRLGPAFSQRRRGGSLVATLLAGVDKLEPFVARFTPQVLLMGIVPPLIAVYVFYLDRLSGIILLVTGPLIPLFMWLLGSLAQRQSDKQWRTLSRLSGHFLEVLQGLTTLKLFNRSKTQLKTIAQVSDNYRRSTMNVLKVAFLSGLVLELAAMLSTALVAVTVGIRLVQGNMDFEAALLVLLLTPEYYLPFRQLGVHHHAGMEGLAAAEDIYAILDKDVPVATNTELPQVATVELELANLSYQYPDASRAAVQNLTALLTPGTVTALVGASGAGKTTLVKLLLRFLQWQEGELRVNGLPLSQFQAESWRSLVALVSQSPYIFDDTVLENLRLARPTANLAEIEEATKLAEAHDFINDLPLGYDTPLGERGLRLSGCERQRLAIARAFLKDAPLLIFDEASSALDPETEATISRALQKLKRGRTVLVIAHRLTTIKAADQILLMDEGRIVERGSHQGLLAAAGRYAELVAAFAEVAA